MSDDHEKGTVLHGKCNRTACQKPGAHWQHKDNRKFYCQPCAFAIMRWPENEGLLERCEPPKTR
jgi:hypothetical protein